MLGIDKRRLSEKMKAKMLEELKSLKLLLFFIKEHKRECSQIIEYVPVSVL